MEEDFLIFFSFGRCILTYLYFVTGLLPFVNIKENSIQFPLYTDKYFQQKKNESNTFYLKFCYSF